MKITFPSNGILLLLLLSGRALNVEAKKKERNNRRSYIAAPTEAPFDTLDAETSPPTSESTSTPTLSPVLAAETKKPTYNVPGTSTVYNFSTAPAEIPTLNAETSAPHCVNETVGESPTEVPISNAETVAPTPTLSPTDESTLQQSDESTLVSTDNIPGTDSSYDFTTAPGNIPTTNTQDGPTAVPISNTETVAPSPASIPTLPSAPVVQTLAPVWAPSQSPSMSVTPLGPPSEILDAATAAPNINVSLPVNATGSGNSTGSCKSSSGSFFLTGNNNETISYELDVFTFSYELETLPRVTANDAIASLESAFVDSLLADLFPLECQVSTSLSMRLLQTQYVVGISKEPEDEVAGDCEPQLSEKNRCALVDGKLSIFSVDGETEEIMDIVKESLIDSMNQGEFIDADAGIVRVSYSHDEIQDDGIQEDSDNSINEDNEADIVKPADNQGSSLGIGLSLSAAGLLLVAVGASVYRRKRKMRENDASTLQEGGTVNGLSRFDVNSLDAPSTDESYVGGARELKILPLSPAARSIVENRYTTSRSNDPVD